MAGAARPRRGARGGAAGAARDAAASTSAELAALVALARRVERHFGCHQDIEWAIGHDGELFVVQSRPVTATAKPAAAPTQPTAISLVMRQFGAAPARTGRRGADRRGRSRDPAADRLSRSSTSCGSRPTGSRCMCCAAARGRRSGRPRKARRGTRAAGRRRAAAARRSGLGGHQGADARCLLPGRGARRHAVRRGRERASSRTRSSA